MKKYIYLTIVIAFFSCKRECDCQELGDKYFQSEKIDLPTENKIILPSESDLNISIDENNVLRLDSELTSIIEIDSIIVELLEDEQEPKIEVYADAKSDFSVFNDVLNLSKTHNLKLVIAQK